MILTLQAAPASATPAPPTSPPIVPDSTVGLDEENELVSPPLTNTFTATGQTNCSQVSLKNGNLDWGHRHIIRPGGGHTYTTLDQQETAHCLANSPSTPYHSRKVTVDAAAGKIVYECCQPHPTRATRLTCRIVVIRTRDCTIINSYKATKKKP